MWNRVRNWFASRWVEPLSADAFRRERESLLGRSPVPVLLVPGDEVPLQAMPPMQRAPWIAA